MAYVSNEEITSIATMQDSSKPETNHGAVFVSTQSIAEVAIYSRKTLFLVLLLAFTLRAVWMLYNSQAMENEGAEYARIAQNLLRHHGYVGILGGLESIDPPVYPLLIAATSFVTRDTEIAGRLISIVFGSLLVLPMFFIGLRLFGSRAGYLASTIVALHPLLVALSASVYVESTYLTLLFGGLYFGMRVLDFHRLSHAFFCGLLLGLAYLTRPEGLAYALLVGVFILFALALRATSIVTALRYGATLAITTVILVIPYATYLSVHSGTFRLEGKSSVNEIINRRMNRGMPYHEAGYGLGPNLEPEGPYLTADQFSLKVRSMSAQLATVARSYFRGIAKRTRHIVSAVLTGRSFGSPLICLLVLVGIFRPGRADRKWLAEGLVLSFAGLTLVILLSLRFIWSRYLFPFLPFLVLWGAAGIDSIADWIAGRFPPTSAPRAAIATRVVLTAAILLWAIPGVRKDIDLSETSKAYIKEAGLWLDKYRPGDKNLMAVGSSVPYYAHGTLFYLPYTDSAPALAYIHRKHPDFVVLQADELDTRPYMQDWFEHSIPDNCAQLIRHTEGPVLQQIEIYQWTCSD